MSNRWPRCGLTATLIAVSPLIFVLTVQLIVTPLVFVPLFGCEEKFPGFYECIGHSGLARFIHEIGWYGLGVVVTGPVAIALYVTCRSLRKRMSFR